MDIQISTETSRNAIAVEQNFCPSGEIGFAGATIIRRPSCTTRSNSSTLHPIPTHQQKEGNEEKGHQKHQTFCGNGEHFLNVERRGAFVYSNGGYKMCVKKKSMNFCSTPNGIFLKKILVIFPLNQLLIFTNKFCFDTHVFEPNFVALIRDLK